LPGQPALGGEGGEGGSVVVPINMLVCDWLSNGGLIIIII
jgi:GTPase involved in cell partitioning and DNA repair